MTAIKPILLLLTCLLIYTCNSEMPEEKAPTQKASVAVEEVDTYLAQDTFSIDFLMGKYNPADHPAFDLIDIKHADRAGLYIHKETYAAFKKMYAAAAADGVNLVIRSATRNFESQKGIWEAKWNGSRKIENGKDASVAYPDPKVRALTILKYSSMPSTSRHHWGTDIDLNSFNNEWFESGKGLKLYNWLQEHAAEYGFCQTYTAKDAKRPNGYNEERWHWSYLPIANILTAKAKRELDNSMIQGFLGHEVAPEINVVSNYVLGINQACQP
ncbi:MAG: M15 family metallopeptidase [Bacteroidota bacterium]